MDYKTLFSDINVANEVLFAEDEEKGSFTETVLFIQPLSFTGFIRYLEWLEGTIQGQLVSFFLQ